MGTYKTYNENDSVKLGKFLKCGVGGDKNGLMNVHPQNWRITIFISRAPSLRSLVKVFKLLITVRLINHILKRMQGNINFFNSLHAMRTLEPVESYSDLFVCCLLGNVADCDHAINAGPKADSG